MFESVCRGNQRLMAETHLLQPNECEQLYFLIFALQQFGQPGSEELCVCGDSTDLAQHSEAAALSVWSDGFEPLASSSPCLCLWKMRVSRRRRKLILEHSVYTKNIYFLQLVFENRNAKQRSFRNPEKSKYRQGARLKAAHGPNRSRTGWRWIQVAECLRTVLINAVCEAGQSGGKGAAGQPAEVQLRCFENTVSVFP